MPVAQSLIAVGIPPAQAEQLGYSNLTPVTALGTSSATALAIRTQVTQIEVTASAGNTGLRLPSDADFQQDYLIFNSSATTAQVYPPDGGSINGTTTDAPIFVGTNVTAVFTRLDRTRWIESDNFSHPSGGIVDSISIASANGFSGSSSGGTTPTLTLGTTLNGLLGGDGSRLVVLTETGSGGPVVVQQSPTLITPNLGTPSAIDLSNATGFPYPTGGTGILPINNGGTPDPVFATTVTLAAATVPNTINGCHVVDFSSLGDGGGHRRIRVTAQPAWGGIRSLDRYLPNGSIDAANGGWWDVNEANPNELMFGGVASASNSAQTTAIASLLSYCGAKPVRKANIVAAHTVTSALTVPDQVCMEWGSGFGASATAYLIKGFNGDMLTLGNGSYLIRPQLHGVGATWTGRGIVINTGSDQVIYDALVLDMAGPCLEFPTGGAGTRFRCINGFFQCHTITDPAIVMPATELTTTGYRHFFNTHSGGSNLIQFNNGNYTIMFGCVMLSCDFSGSTTGQVKLVGCRIASLLTVSGLQHTINDCSIGNGLTLDGSSSYCVISGNEIAAAPLIINSGASNNQIFGNSIASGPGTITDNSGVNTNTIVDQKYLTTTPTVTAGTGTFTSVTCTLFYQRSANVVVWNALINITTAGTAAGALFIPLPHSPFNNAPVYGHEAINGLAVSGYTQSGSPSCRIKKYDGNTIISDGSVIVVGGSYQI